VNAFRGERVRTATVDTVFQLVTWEPVSAAPDGAEQQQMNP
jgi:hypothetical protein